MLLFNLSTEFDENGKQNAVADSDLVSFLFIVQFYDIILSITFFLRLNSLSRFCFISIFTKHT